MMASACTAQSLDLGSHHLFVPQRGIVVLAMTLSSCAMAAKCMLTLRLSAPTAEPTASGAPSSTPLPTTSELTNEPTYMPSAAPTEAGCALEGQYVVNMQDSYGDGW